MRSVLNDAEDSQTILQYTISAVNNDKMQLCQAYGMELDAAYYDINMIVIKGCRGYEVVFLEAVPVFDIRNCRFFHGTIGISGGTWCEHVHFWSYSYCFYCCQTTGIWQFGSWMGVSGLHYLVPWRCTVAVPGNFRILHVKNVSGSKEPSDLYLR